MLKALTQVLQLPSEECWASALHGLGHLEHPGKHAVIERFLAEHPDLDEDTVKYAGAAMAGDIL